MRIILPKEAIARLKGRTMDDWLIETAPLRHPELRRYNPKPLPEGVEQDVDILPDDDLIGVAPQKHLHKLPGEDE